MRFPTRQDGVENRDNWSIDFSFAPFAANLPAETVEPVHVVKNNGILGDQGLILILSFPNSLPKKAN